VQKQVNFILHLLGKKMDQLHKPLVINNVSKLKVEDLSNAILLDKKLFMIITLF